VYTQSIIVSSRTTLSKYQPAEAPRLSWP